VDGKVYHFGAIGLTDGLAVLADRETRTHWDHITGEAVKGRLAGRHLDVWPVQMTTVAAASIEHPEISVSPSNLRHFNFWLAKKLYPSFIYKKGWLPKFFYLSMSEPIDPRLNKLTQGLGVVVGKQAKFYPMTSIPAEGIEEAWNGRTLNIAHGVIDGVPYAVWKDNGEKPMQLLSRWYGFSFTYPGCEIHKE
jgi:hypothetical protein